MTDITADPVPEDEDAQTTEKVEEDETVEDADGSTENDEDLGDQEPAR